MSDPVSDTLCDEAGESGSLLAELERRQDDVLNLLDDLDRRLTDVLKGLGVTLVDENEPGGPRLLETDDRAEDDAEGDIGPAGKREQRGGYRAARDGHTKDGEISAGFIKLPRAEEDTPAARDRAAA